MGIIVIAAILGLGVATGVVQFGIARSGSFTFRTVVVTALLAVLLVFAVATVVAYFLARVRIGDHYEVNSVLMGVFVVWPATIAAVIGAACGAYLARHSVRPRP